MTALRTGDRVGPRYRLISPLGDGGSGTVWRAHDAELDIDVALKILRNPTGDREGMLARFAHEAELSARMLSRNVVHVIDRGVDDRGVPYIAYELLEGDELGERIAREGRLSLALCAAVIVQVCRALARAHAVGVIHRDIKPENIFVCEDDGRPLIKLLDFGIARLHEPRSGQSRRENIGGTLEYLSPEVLLDGKQPDARSDLYALGVVAYECFTGRVPFEGGSLGHVLLAHAQTVPPSPSSMRMVKDELASAIDAWFERALHRDPDQRFQTAKEMAEAFVVVHRPKMAGSIQPPAGPASRPPPPMRSKFPTLSGVDFGESPTSVRPSERVSSEYRVIGEPRPEKKTK